jgi:hypothetical protein
MPWVRAVQQGRPPHSGFSFRLLRPQCRAQPSIRDSGVEGRNGQVRPGDAAEPRAGNRRRTSAPFVPISQRRAGKTLFRQQRQRRRGSRDQVCASQHRTLFGQIMVMRMFREKQILTQICGNNFMVLKAAPPLIVTAEQLDEFVQAIRGVAELAEMSPTFRTEVPGMTRRAVNL